jgi:hypothetical protein
MVDPGSCNAEFKAFDGSTNPYIGVAAIVAAGLAGADGLQLAAWLCVYMHTVVVKSNSQDMCMHKFAIHVAVVATPWMT